MPRENKNAPSPPAARILRREDAGHGPTLTLSGRLDAAGTAAVWDAAVAMVRAAGTAPVTVDASGVTHCSGPGIGLLLELTLLARQAGGTLAVTGLDPKFHRLFDLHDPVAFLKNARRPGKRLSLPEELGREAWRLSVDVRHLISFVGEFATALAVAARHPGRVRWKDALAVAETAGVNALPIILLVGFLMGLIMAFQSAVPLKQFGAEIYVAKLLVISMTRELGPLVTAIILAGRSGSAFAAEIGTMSVNEEIHALVTMGLDPVRFLVVTRVLAAVAMTPILSIFFTLASLVGGALVMLTFGYPLVTYLNQLQSSASIGDILGGLSKSAVFGFFVCGIGCLRGLQTRGGPSAVGDATTSAVVSGIILIAVADGVFAVLFYAMGW
ncbi:ABC transporter permease [Desulfolutivibrio sulfoxidireducens]|uniref:ABC transporter permease n=1 Tax=Desulfolutivibrio sulfoxidireducens TaxID=2773299 RepID=UPI00159E0A40|nr:ABC transporter permease [Desulfolutivibrio sulfoxidireducens]QLA20481.1 STAS domain-containing protein [Desulfolutivibrio sulfoxidireducens]